jgi:hypothetical protein
MVLPLEVEDFTSNWSLGDQRTLEKTLAAAGDVRVIGGDPATAYTERNRFLAIQADLLVAVWAGVKRGGTFETISFAREAGVAVREVLLEPSPEAGSAQGHGI